MSMPASFARLAAPALMALLLLGAPTPTRAALVLTVNNSVATAGGTGSFDVLLSSTGGSFQVGGFSVELGLAANSGVLFTAATTATTTAAYLYGTDQTPPLTFASFPNQDFVASDSDASSPGYVTLAAGMTFGLEHVTYSVAAGIVGPITVSILGVTGTAATTQVDDGSGNPLPFTPVNGTITVTPAATVPEPSSFGLTALALALGAGIARSRRR